MAVSRYIHTVFFIHCTFEINCTVLYRCIPRCTVSAILGLSKNRRDRTEQPSHSWRPYRRPVLDGSTGQPDRWRRDK